MRKSNTSHLLAARMMLSVLDSRTLSFVRSFSDVLFTMLLLGYLYLYLSFDKITGRRRMYHYPWFLRAGTGTPVPG